MFKDRQRHHPILLDAEDHLLDRTGLKLRLREIHSVHLVSARNFYSVPRPNPSDYDTTNQTSLIGNLIEICYTSMKPAVEVLDSWSRSDCSQISPFDALLIVPGEE